MGSIWGSLKTYWEKTEFNDVAEMSLNWGLPAEWVIVWTTNNHDRKGEPFPVW